MRSFCCFILFLLAASPAFPGEIEYAYDQAGRLTGVNCQGGSRTTYVYDAMGNLLCSGDDCDIHVEATKVCGGKKPCFDLIARGLDASGFVANVLICSDASFAENITLARDTQVLLQGGWNAGFSEQNGSSVIQGSLTLEKGTVEVDGIEIGSAPAP